MQSKRTYDADQLASMAAAVPKLLSDSNNKNWAEKVEIAEAVAREVAEYARALADQSEAEALAVVVKDHLLRRQGVH